MAPLHNGEVVRDADGFTRDEKGRRTMAHLLALMAMVLAFVVTLAGIAFVALRIQDGATLVLAAVGLAGSAAGLDAIQTRVEARRETARGPQ